MLGRWLSYFINLMQTIPLPEPPQSLNSRVLLYFDGWALWRPRTRMSLIHLVVELQGNVVKNSIQLLN